MGGEKNCVVPGAFDPITNGHLDIIMRASEIFDKIYVAVFENSAKKTMFSLDERRKMAEIACGELNCAAKIKVESSNGLVIDYAQAKNAGFIIRGARNIIDFEWECDVFRANCEISGEKYTETLFFPAKTEHLHISSTFVREMIIYEKDISRYVPEQVEEYINALIKNKRRDLNVKT